MWKSEVKDERGYKRVTEMFQGGREKATFVKEMQPELFKCILMQYKCVHLDHLSLSDTFDT